MKAFWCERCQMQVPVKSVGGKAFCHFCLCDVVAMDEVGQGQQVLQLEYPSVKRKRERAARWKRLRDAAE